MVLLSIYIYNYINICTSYKETEHCEAGSTELETLFLFALYFHIIRNSILL